MMKNIYLFSALLFLFTINLSAQEEVNWMSMEEALEAQKEEPKKIILDAYTDWCYPCKLMDKRTFGNEKVAAFINENFYAVKFNAEGKEEVNYKNKVFKNKKYDPARAGRRNHQHDFAKVLKIRAYPTIVYFDEEGNTIAPIPGYQKPAQIEVYLKMMLNDDYKNLTSAEEFKAYQENFESTFDK